MASLIESAKFEPLLYYLEISLGNHCLKPPGQDDFSLLALTTPRKLVTYYRQASGYRTQDPVDPRAEIRSAGKY